MKSTIFLITGLLMINMTHAQIDQERMERDLAISKNILATLLKEEGNRWVSEHRIEASYIEDYGVIINIPENIMHFRISGFHPNVRIEEFKPFIYEYDAQMNHSEMEELQKEAQKMQEEAKKMQRELQSRIEIRVESDDEKHNGSNEGSNDQNKDNEIVDERIRVPRTSGLKKSKEDIDAEREQIRSIIITFLADYADLIHQLEPDDHIMVKRNNQNGSFVFVPQFNEDGNEAISKNSGLSITALKQDITAYKSGKIDKDEFTNRLEINMGKESKKIADLEIFGNVFKQYFSPEYSNDFFTYDRPQYDRIENVGAIYNVQIHTDFDGSDFKGVSPNKTDLSTQDKNKIREESGYNSFIENLKAFIVDYGRTIRALDADEQLIMKLKLNACPLCGLPDSIDITAKMSTLMDYDQQKISKDKAVDKISIQESK